MPSANFIAEKLHISTNYLGSFLKSLTGQTTHQHIHEKSDPAGERKTITTSLSISEIVYELGFENSQSFSKLFKSKTDLSPLEFRKTFN